jgi:hypothetical protein
LTSQRDQTVAEFVQRYRLPGYENPPFTAEQIARLLSKGNQMLNNIKQRFQDNKVKIIKEYILHTHIHIFSDRHIFLDKKK